MESCASFVVHDVDGGLPACGGEPAENVVVRGNSMCVLFGGKRADEDGIGVGVEGDHDVLVAAAGSRCEATRVVGEEVRQRELVNCEAGIWEGLSVDLRVGHWMAWPRLC